MTLRVDRMIIHLVAHQDQEFLPRDKIEVQQKGFFRARIQSEAGDGVHSFSEDSPLRPILERMARQELDFTEGGRQLAHGFWELHVRQSISGAFFVRLYRFMPVALYHAAAKGRGRDPG